MSRKILLEVKNLKQYFPLRRKSVVKAVDDVSFHIYEGETFGLVGESGSGKSTLMNIIGVLDKQTKGEYYLDGIDIKNANEAEMNVIRNKKIGFVFQNFNLIGRTSALRNVELPMLYAGVPAEQRTKRAKELLSKVGMESRMNHMPNELSGGQKQRVAIARSLVNNPAIILADEPTGALDSETSTMVMNIFNDLNKNQGKTIILITHSKEIAEQCPRIVTIKDGKIINDSKEVVS